MDRIDGNDTSFAQACERGDDDISAGRKGHGPVELDGRLVGFTAYPSRAQRLSQLAMRSAARRYIHVTLP